MLPCLVLSADYVNLFLDKSFLNSKIKLFIWNILTIIKSVKMNLILKGIVFSIIAQCCIPDRENCVWVKHGVLNKLT